MSQAMGDPRPTRREQNADCEAVTPQPPEGYICAGRLLDTTGHHDRKNIGKIAFTDLDYKDAHYYKLPFEVGDVLMGRESYYHIDSCEYCMCDDEPDDQSGCFLYEATHDSDAIKWRSPVTMPPEAVRIKLAVSGVRVLRVQELTKEECMAIGIKNPANDGYNWGRFASQWDVDYLKCPKYEMNPWAIVAEIERMI